MNVDSDYNRTLAYLLVRFKHDNKVTVKIPEMIFCIRRFSIPVIDTTVSFV